MLIALGVTGGIGAYKAVEVARGLQKRGHDVVAIMTADATRFVGPSRSKRSRAGRSSPISSSRARTPTSSTSRWRRRIDLLLVAPATANIIGKFANGIADDFLSTLYVATRAPVLVAPAMNTQMFAHEAVRRNLDTLAAHGVRFVEPGEGYLACGWIGKGRLAEPDEIVAAAESMLRPAGPLRGSACWSPRARRTKTSIRCATSAIDRAAAWDSRSRPRPRAGAPRSRSSRARRPSSRRACARLVRVRSAAEMHEAVMARADRCARRRHGGGGRRLHARAPRAAEGRQARRHADAGADEDARTSWPIWGSGA